ncbi:MAG: translation initiation factor IF-2 [Candidatus Altiarchaeota archaeon]|nr:translation initiation factor IF-2 [Candidatus Altiarchaeota archaeon]
MEKTIRQPIISVLGHVDHGKTNLLDRIRRSSVAAREAGGITQHIGATEVPIEVVKKICGDLLTQMKLKITIPGLLFVDTPGHEAFTNLRKRGGSIADLAILVVDLREGFMPQTIEALEILKSYKTPFIIAANKIDLIRGWRNNKTFSSMESFKQQPDYVRDEIDSKIYELISRLSDFKIDGERFDRVSDFTKQVSIVPVSAKTSEGIAEVLMLLSGLSQRYLEESLKIEVSGPGKGSILEVKEERGLGTTLDVILYEGAMKRGDVVVLSGINGPIKTKVKALLKPKPLDEMRDPKDKFDNVASLPAASGVKVVGPDIDDALPGGQIYVAENEASVRRLAEQITKELESLRFDKENVGVIVSADTLGSLEGILKILSQKGIPVRKADIGAVNKKDLTECESLRSSAPECGVILAFNVPVPDDIRQLAKDKGLKIIENKVIYKILEELEAWRKEVKKAQEMSIFDTTPFPAEITFLPGFVFRRSDPAVVGVQVVSGKIKPGYQLMKKDGTRIGSLVSLQDKGQKLLEANKGDKVAAGIDGPLVGRNIDEGDTFYTYISQSQYEGLLKRGKRFLTSEDETLLKEIMKIVRSKNI